MSLPGPFFLAHGCWNASTPLIAAQPPRYSERRPPRPWHRPSPIVPSTLSHPLIVDPTPHMSMGPCPAVPSDTSPPPAPRGPSLACIPCPVAHPWPAYRAPRPITGPHTVPRGPSLARIPCPVAHHWPAYRAPRPITGPHTVPCSQSLACGPSFACIPCPAAHPWPAYRAPRPIPGPHTVPRGPSLACITAYRAPRPLPGLHTTPRGPSLAHIPCPVAHHHWPAYRALRPLTGLHTVSRGLKLVFIPSRLLLHFCITPLSCATPTPVLLSGGRRPTHPRRAPPSALYPSLVGRILCLAPSSAILVLQLDPSIQLSANAPTMGK